MNLDLRWHGPYSVIEGTTTPCLFTSATETTGCLGVYLWTVQSGDEDLVFYVGKTDVNFAHRLSTEFRSRRRRAWDWVDDPEMRRARIARPDCWDWVPDPEQLQRGVKKWVYEPRGWKKPNLALWAEHEARFQDCWRRFVETVRIFVAPMTGTRREIKDTETALMWAVWNHEDANRLPGSDGYFLTNGAPIPRRLPYQYSIRSAAPVRFRGIGEVVSG